MELKMLPLEILFKLKLLNAFHELQAAVIEERHISLFA